ncbi:MAG: LytR C-terminal domain-containing protein [Candidatus Moranbacteria bacterium]|nr:LytR C-terminal domain-containing protein [Candidatus Moranbacteria bacterium]
MEPVETEGEAAEKKETISATPTSSRESLLGTLLIGFLIVVVLAALALIGWGVYRGWHFTQEQTALPSIATLPIQPEEAPPQEAASDSVVAEQPLKAAGTEAIVKKAQGTDIKVLNGGATKGSAGAVTEILKKAGYTKATFGNTVNNYTGAVVYFATGLDQEAGALKDALIKTYPKIETRPALPTNKETTRTPLMVILGK